ncbi:unnamed protein product [Gongylonema pulchrum]|uniref:Uncharacterized protein n=1 Tax=Gongylonema pulchrum TaxID=637853 RepID=A0A3P6P121_9BILA|nr:unnamed protein product [Gongylonema pulchrum]
MANGTASADEYDSAKNWTYKPVADGDFISLHPDQRRVFIISVDDKAPLRCEFLKYRYGFIEQALSYEEQQYPIAYGILVHIRIDQVYYMLSAIYAPQNQYCIAVDDKATKEFKEAASYLQQYSAKSLLVHQFCINRCLLMLAEFSKFCERLEILPGIKTP